MVRIRAGIYISCVVGLVLGSFFAPLLAVTAQGHDIRCYLWRRRGTCYDDFETSRVSIDPRVSGHDEAAWIFFLLVVVFSCLGQTLCAIGLLTRRPFFSDVGGFLSFIGSTLGWFGLREVIESRRLLRDDDAFTEVTSGLGSGAYLLSTLSLVGFALGLFRT